MKTRREETVRKTKGKMKNSRCRTTNLIWMPSSLKRVICMIYTLPIDDVRQVSEREREKKVKNVSERVFDAIMNGSAVSIVKCLDSMAQTNNEQVEQMLQIHDNNIEIREAAHKNNGNNRIKRKKNSTKRNKNSQMAFEIEKKNSINSNRDRAKWNIEKCKMKYMRVEMCVCVCLHFVCFHWCEADDLIK